jgi:hydrogenase-4 component F
VKRLLGYSSIEHMGLLALALGLGGVGAYGAVLHTLNNAVAKVMVFLAVGNVTLASGTSVAGRIRGLLRRMPVSGTVLVVGLFAITGSPPFGMFLSEFTIIKAAVESYPWIAIVLVLLLSVILVGIAAMILEMVYGDRADADAVLAPIGPERPWLLVAPLALAVLVLGLGLYLPAPLADALASAALTLGGHAP